MEPGDVDRLTKAIDKLNSTANRLDSSLNSGAPGNGNNVSNVNLNAGGWGVWISVTCVIVLAVMNNSNQVTITRLEQKYERMQDYLNSIYAQAPHLKPKEEKK